MVWPLGFAMALPWQGVLEGVNNLHRDQPIARLRSSRPKFLHDSKCFSATYTRCCCSATLDSPSKLEARDLRRHRISLYIHYIYRLNYTFGEKALREQRSQIPWESLAFQTETILDKMTVSLCDYVHVIACNIYIVKLHKASYPSSHRHWSFLLLMNFQHLDGQLESSNGHYAMFHHVPLRLLQANIKCVGFWSNNKD